MKRNPYLVEFEAQRSQGYARRTGQALDSRQQAGRRQRSIGREDAYAKGRQSAGRDGESRGTRREGSRELYIGEQRSCGQRGGFGTRMDQAPLRRPAGRKDAVRRRRMAAMQRVLAGVWIFCLLVLAATLLIRNSQVSAGEKNGVQQGENAEAGAKPQYSGYLVQGLPAEEFAKHPAWTEDFLTVNEYSRPGDPLESVKNIFVHYTANPGTSAAQNKSYFEWLKDTHETSASAHFIIGYEGEIIQCVPLDEIAYAVQSRNGDSVSIECCYLAADGSFTQETYDSLISLLKWLVDVYDLETEDILRHYDCGGKKCPIYYTENPDAWEELKKDVDKL